MINRVLRLVCVMMLLSSFSVKAQSVVADKIVAVVGNSAILYSEVNEYATRILQNRKEQRITLDRDAKTEALEQLMLQKLLYNQALVDSLTISTEDIAKAVDENIEDQIRERGSVRALETFYHKPVFDIKEDLRKKYEEQRYASMMHSDVTSKVKITPGEVDRFYRSISKDSLPIIPEQYVYAQIIKYPTSTQEAKQRVRQSLLDLRERIINGTKFDVLARMYSVDMGSAVRGGEMDPSPKESYVQPFADALAKLKPGQVSDVVETEYGFHLIELIGKEGKLYHCRHILMKPIFSDEELRGSDKTLDSLRTVILEDRSTFAKVAKDNSDDPYSRLNGGLVSNHDMLEMSYAFDAKLTSTKFLKEDMQKEDLNALTKLKPGEISPVYRAMDFKGNHLSKFVKLVEVIPAHSASLKEDYLRLEELALKNKQAKEFELWLDKKISGMFVRVAPEFKNADFENKNWLK